LPLIFAKRLCDVFDDELNKVAAGIGSRAKAFALVGIAHKLVRFYMPSQSDNPDDAVWSVIRNLSDKIGETLTTYLRAIAKENILKGDKVVKTLLHQGKSEKTALKKARFMGLEANQ
jgi:type I restriction enzyme M protein